VAVSRKKGLISLADAKRFMGLSADDKDDDRLIDQMVTQASVLIAKELGYNPVSTTYREFYSGDGGYNLWLENIPVTSVDMVSVSRSTAATIEYDATDASRATVEVTTNKLRLRKVVSGTVTLDELVLSDYATFTALETAVEALGNWTVVVTDNWATFDPTDLVPVPARDANNRTTNLDVPEECEAEYELFGEEGRLYNPYGWTAGNNNICVRYTAGWDEIPEPLQSACAELTKMLYDTSRRDVSLRSESIGDYKYTVADRLDAAFSASGDTKTSNMISLKLMRYRRAILFGA